MIAIRNTDNIALYKGNLTLTSDGLYGNGWVDKRLNISNCTLLDMPAPDEWEGCAYEWNGTELVLRDDAKPKMQKRLKREQIERVKAEWHRRLETANFNGTALADIRSDVLEAAWIIANGIAANHPAIVGDEAIILNAAKLTTIMQFRADCAQNARAHIVAIKALNAIPDIRNYDYSTGWPSPDLTH